MLTRCVPYGEVLVADRRTRWRRYKAIRSRIGKIVSDEFDSILQAKGQVGLCITQHNTTLHNTT